MRRAVLATGVACALIAIGGPGTALGGQATITDPRNDTAMGRGGPDIVTARISHGQRIVATLSYAAAPESLGTISGVKLAFRNGRSYVLQRRSADPAFGTPLTNEIVSAAGSRVRCSGVASSVSRAARTVTVSAPASCFAGKGTALKAQGFTFTRNFDTDETRWTGWVAAQKKKPSAKKKKQKQKKVTYQIVRLGESAIMALQTADTSAGGTVRNTNALAKFTGLRCVDGKCRGASVIVTASLRLQRRVNGAWTTVLTLPAAGRDTVVAPRLTKTFPNAAVIRYVWSGQAQLGKERAPFTRSSSPLTVQ